MKRVFIAMLCAVALIGCSKSDETTPEVVTPDESLTKIPINITSGIWTKVTDTAYETNDKVGLYVVNYTNSNGTAGTLATSGNHATNVGFTYSSAWSADSAIYWLDNTTAADFYCYYPYTSSITSVTAHSVAVKTDQSTSANYKASEFLWGKSTAVSPTTGAVAIETNHTMSKVIIKLAEGTGYTTNEFQALTKSVAVCNTKPNATISLSTGVATATGSVADITPYKTDTDTYQVLIVPQEISSVNFVKVTIDDVAYYLKVSKTFATNTEYTCTVTIDKSSNGVNVGIGGWDDGGDDFGGTAV